MIHDMKEHKFEILFAFYEVRKMMVSIALTILHPEKQKMLYFSFIQHSLVFHYVLLDFYIDYSGDRK